MNASATRSENGAGANRIRALLIDFGDLPSLAAVAMQHDPAAVALWSVAPAGAERRRAMALAHRDLLDCKLLSEPLWSDEEDHAALLLQATRLARRLGARRVIWPARFGPEHSQTETVLRTAAMISGLEALRLRSEAAVPSGGAGGAGGAGVSPLTGGDAVEVEAPFADLDADQVVDLADDAGAPLDRFWPCDQEGVGAVPCGACAGCREWMAAFEARELAWPFSRSAASPGAGVPGVPGEPGEPGEPGVPGAG